MARNTDFTIQVDLAVGRKIHERRICYGWSRVQLAEEIGVTHQQIQKYETGANRVSIGRLLTIARALRVKISYFTDDYEDSEELPDQHRRLAIEVSRGFLKIKNPVHQAGVHYLIKTLEDK